MTSGTVQDHTYKLVQVELIKKRESEVHAVLGDPEICTRVLRAPVNPVVDGVLVFFRHKFVDFSCWLLGSKEPKFLATSKKKHRLIMKRQGQIITRARKAGSMCQKRCEHFGLCAENMP